MDARVRLNARAQEVIESPMLIRLVAANIRTGEQFASVLNDVTDLGLRDRLLEALLPLVAYDPERTS